MTEQKKKSLYGWTTLWEFSRFLFQEARDWEWVDIYIFSGFVIH